MKNSILILGFGVLMSCDSNDLGDNYYYMDEFMVLDIGYPEGQVIYRADKNWFSSSFRIDKVIDGNVIALGADEQYIIAKQKYDEKLEKSILISEFEFWNHYIRGNTKCKSKY